MQTVFTVLAMAWGFFSEVQCPFLGISFASLFLGVFVVGFSVRLLKPLLGLGAHSLSDAERIARRNNKGG